MLREYQVDERTTARVGYPDGHVELDIQLPAPWSLLKGSITYTLSPEAIQRSLPVMLHAAKILKGLGYRL